MTNTYPTPPANLYSLIIAIHSTADAPTPDTDDPASTPDADWRLGDITVDWVDFTREKSVDKPQPPDMAPESSAGSSSVARGGAKKSTPQPKPVPGSSTSARTTPSKRRPQQASHTATPSALSLQPLLAHFPTPTPLSSSFASGTSSVGRGVVHLFKHAPPATLIASLDAHPVGESSRSAATGAGAGEAGSRAGASGSNGAEVRGEDWAGERAEGEDGSLIAILAVPAWMRPADFLEWLGGWGTCVEGVRMIREATTPNRSIVLLKFRDPLQASDFLVIFTGKAFSTLDTRETCHPIRIHHLVLHKLDVPSQSPVAVPAFPPSVYASRLRSLPTLLGGVPEEGRHELPSCPVCLERLDSTVTGLVTLPCAHTFDCDCLRKWGDSRCPVCRLSHLLLSSSSSSAATSSAAHHPHRDEITRLTRCSMCSSTENNWICVVCGVVGCGRYDPGKGHARRHWEESGHVLAMELETQRVWDYEGDNYVHRLIQTRNDGKLVELPSASSLVTQSSVSRPLPLGSTTATPERRPAGTSADSGNASGSPAPAHHSYSTAPAPHAGPSSSDIDKISTIEAITLEYSYLLSSQLEAMRQHYESAQADMLARMSALEASTTEAGKRVADLEKAEKERERAEKKAEKAVEVCKAVQTSLAGEKAMTQGLSERVKVLEKERDEAVKGRKEKEEECSALEETVRDLMFSLDASSKIQELGGEGGEGGDVMVAPAKSKKKWMK
ncbi:hypothetical protein IAT38_005865 [Cryptococcus sp. DSM 104549]